MWTIKHTLSITEEMEKRLEAERERRCLQTIPETIRAILSEYLVKHPLHQQRRSEQTG
jgi:hypothetical protein